MAPNLGRCPKAVTFRAFGGVTPSFDTALTGLLTAGPSDLEFKLNHYPLRFQLTSIWHLA